MKKLMFLLVGLSILATGLMAGKCEFNSPVMTQQKEEPKQAPDSDAK